MGSPIYLDKNMSRAGIVDAIILAMTFPCLGGYAIVLNPVERALEGTLDTETWKTPLLARVVLRSGFVAFTALVAIVLEDKFPPLLNLVAAFTSTCTEFIFPSLFYLRLCKLSGVRISFSERVWN